jgi:hypothetical protein
MGGIREMGFLSSLFHPIEQAVHTITHPTPATIGAAVATYFGGPVAGAATYKVLGGGISSQGAAHQLAVEQSQPTFNIITGGGGFAPASGGGFSSWPMDSFQTSATFYPASAPMYPDSLTPFQEQIFHPDWGE